MAEKTEKPTEKRRKDSAKKGQTFKSKDLITTVSFIFGFVYIYRIMNFDLFSYIYMQVLYQLDNITLNDFILELIRVFFLTVSPLIITCAFAGIITTLIQTKFSIATESLKLNFKALNPIEGFKKIFSLRTVKELIKSIFYLIVFSSTTYFLIKKDIRIALSAYHAELNQLIQAWVALCAKSVIIFLSFSIFVLLMDFFLEYFLHFKDLKMDKHEVKREHKENDGNPEIKNARRCIHFEILSGEEMSAIRNSEVILANPTHIAIGIYFNPEVAALPFVALRVTNQKALVAISYAEKIGVPVVRYIPLTRRIYKDYRQYSFISINDDVLMDIMKILIWLKEVERAGLVKETEGEESISGEKTFDSDSYGDNDVTIDSSSQ